MHERGHVWQGVCMAGCVCVGGVHGRGGGMCGRRVCMAGGVWQGACMVGGHACPALAHQTAHQTAGETIECHSWS